MGGIRLLFIGKVMKIKVVYEADQRRDFAAHQTVEAIRQILEVINLNKPVKITLEYESDG